MSDLVFPLDPACPGVQRIEADQQDPMTIASGVGDEIREDAERIHRASCERCREYGAANVEAIA